MTGVLVNTDIMSFITLKSQGKEIILNTSRIIRVDLNSGNKPVIVCTDQVSIQVDNNEADLRKILGVKLGNERSIGF